MSVQLGRLLGLVGEWMGFGKRQTPAQSYAPFLADAIKPQEYTECKALYPEGGVRLTTLYPGDHLLQIVWGAGVTIFIKRADGTTTCEELSHAELMERLDAANRKFREAGVRSGRKR